jgi:hypothetical protein
VGCYADTVAAVVDAEAVELLSLLSRETCQSLESLFHTVAKDEYVEQYCGPRADCGNLVVELFGRSADCAFI